MCLPAVFFVKNFEFLHRVEYRGRSGKKQRKITYNRGFAQFSDDEFDEGVSIIRPVIVTVDSTATGQIQMEIKGLAEPKSEYAQRICSEDLNEVSFDQS